MAAIQDTVFLSNLLPAVSADNADAAGSLSIAAIFRQYWADYRQNNQVTPRQSKVVYDILNCRTGSFGYSISACDNCSHTEVFFNSCRNSHCPNCQGKKRIEWVDSRLNDLLPVPYYHGVFTLPNGIFPFCLYNQQVVYDLLMSSAAKTVEAFGYDSKWLGGKTGFFMVLHTWGQQLCVHPHVHCVIPAIGYNKDKCELVRSKYEKNDFLFPVRGLSKVFRGKFIAGLKEAFNNKELEFKGEREGLSNRGRFEAWLNELVSNEWVVYSKAPFSSSEYVVRYVGRYTHRVAISNSRILSIDNGVIRFKFKNYKKMKEVENYKDLWEEMELSSDEFIRRFLFHVLPFNFRRIRYYGFLSTNNKKLFREIKESLSAGSFGKKDETGRELKNWETHCPCCNKGVLIRIVIVGGNGNLLRGSFIELSEFRKEKKEMYLRQKHRELLTELCAA